MDPQRLEQARAALEQYRTTKQPSAAPPQMSAAEALAKYRESKHSQVPQPAPSKQELIDEERANRSEKGLALSTNKGKASPSFLGEVVRAPLKLGAKVLGGAYNIVKGRDPSAPIKSDYLGTVKPLASEAFNDFSKFGSDVKQAVGAGLEAASYLPAGRAVGATGQAAKTAFRSGFGKAISKAVPAAGESAVGGLLGGTGAGLQEGQSIPQAIGSGVKSGAISGLVGGVAAPVAGLAGNVAGKVRRGAKLTTDSGRKQLVSEEINELVNATKPLARETAFLRDRRGIDIAEKLSDPEMVRGMRPENGNLNVDGTIDTIERRLELAQKAKSVALPMFDNVVPKTSKLELREKILSGIQGKGLPADEDDVIAAVDKQLKALPDDFSLADLDKLRAKARKSARDAKQIQKRDSEYAAIENAARDIVFDKTDNLPFDTDGAVKSLNIYMRDLMTMKEFVEKRLRGHKVGGGRLGNYLAKGIGAGAGSVGGPLGTLVGSEIGGFVSDIIANKALGNSYKMQLIKEVVDDPAVIKQIEKMIGKAANYNSPQLRLPGPTGKPLSDIPIITPNTQGAPNPGGFVPGEIGEGLRQRLPLK